VSPIITRVGRDAVGVADDAGEPEQRSKLAQTAPGVAATARLKAGAGRLDPSKDKGDGRGVDFVSSP
jgi:hypothetical protein